MVPNDERKTAKIEQKVYDWDCPPHHFTRWDKNTIKKFFEMNGFQIEVYEEEYLSISEVATYIGSLIFSDFTKSMNKKLEEESSLSKRVFKKFLRVGRTFVFAPIAVFLRPYFNRAGISLYFQGKIKD